MLSTLDARAALLTNEIARPFELPTRSQPSKRLYPRTCCVVYTLGKKDVKRFFTFLNIKLCFTLVGRGVFRAFF